jgi:Ni,Fe-hydrogenase III component G
VRGQFIRVARREIASLYGLDSITDGDERRHTLEHLHDDDTYTLCVVDRSLPVDVR